MTASSDRRRAELAVIDKARQLVSDQWKTYSGYGLETELIYAVRNLDALPLDEPTKARAGGPLLTSQNAAAFVSGPRAMSMAGRILREIDRRGGMTTEEVCIALDGKHQTVSARIHELWRNGWLRIAGERKTSSRQEASVWQISQEARGALLTSRTAEITREWEGMRDG